MTVRIRMKQLGRRHRPFYRICAIDSRTPRNGRVLEELGTYDPMVPDVDARVTLSSERVDHWLSVGAQPSDKVKVLIKKYGSKGTHLQQQEAARAKLAEKRRRATPPPAETTTETNAPEAGAETTTEPTAPAEAVEGPTAEKSAAEKSAADETGEEKTE